MRILIILFFIPLLVLFSSCNREDTAKPGPAGGESYDLAAELKLLAETFRIDILDIDVTYDIFPDQMRVDGKASVLFKMRPGQKRPLVHFDPGIRENAIDAITLDGETLAFSDQKDVRFREFSGSSQKAIEFQRDLAADEFHILEMRFHLHLPGSYPRFTSVVEDGFGRGNEERFPTINTPGELAVHWLQFRIHGGRRYECVGSGVVIEGEEEDLQTWTLDTQREISSYTLFYALMPAEDVDIREGTIAGVPVRIMGYKGTVSVNEAFAQIAGWLPQFISEIGPYPAPAINVFLVRDGGMEFYGGTISEVAALKHEIFHNYFGCSAIARTYRDSWWDEAMATWYVDKNKGARAYAMADTFYSGIVSGRSPIAVGWDERAYDEGSNILQAAAVRMGGSQAFIGFLSGLYRNHSFSPFNAMELADYIQSYSGVDMHARFLRWLYSYENASSSAEGRSTLQTKKVKLDPPPEILQRYNPVAGVDASR